MLWMLREKPASGPSSTGSYRPRRRVSLLAVILGAAALASLAGALGAQTPDRQDEAERPNVETGTRTPAPGDDIIVVQQNRRRLEGVFVRWDRSSVTVTIARVDVRIDVDAIDRIIVLDPPRERYERMRSLIEDDEIERLIVLAEWLREHDMFAEALDELDHVLSIAPDEPDALRLRAIVREQFELQRRSGDSDPSAPLPGDGAVPDSPEAEPNAGLDIDFPLLSDEQINLMRVFEIDLRDPPQLMIPRETVERLLLDYATSPLVPETREGREALLASSPQEILDLMFRLRAREKYSRVQVLDDPASMKFFRDHVHSTWITNSCATTQCHGGGSAGDLWLTQRRPTSPQSVYTNFLIMERFRLDAETPLIDYGNPARSVLLQMGLPRDDAIRPHPLVRGWRPVFRDREARRFRQAVEWIEGMYRPRPDYPIEYEAPVGRAPFEPSDEGIER